MRYGTQSLDFVFSGWDPDRLYLQRPADEARPAAPVSGSIESTRATDPERLTTLPATTAHGAQTARCGRRTIDTPPRERPLLDLSLLDFVRSQTTSVRLLNSIQAAHAAGTLPFDTLGDYVKAGAQASPRLLHAVRNFGRKTAAELKHMVEALGSTDTLQVVSPCSVVHVDRDALRASLVQLFAAVDTETAMAERSVPTRLANALARSGYAKRPLADVLSDVERITRRLSRQPNMGRTSATAWREALTAIVDARLRNLGVAPELVHHACRFLLDHEEIPEDVAEHLAADVDARASATVSVDESRAQDEVEPLIRELVDALVGRTHDIICRRYGIDGCPAQTLEEIGTIYGVSRERIRQVEHKAIRRFRTLAQRRVRTALDEGTDEMWQALSAGLPVLRDDALAAAAKRASPWLLLALDICQMPLAAWLDAHAHRLSDGWLGPGWSRAQFDALRAELVAALQQRRLPVALCELPAHDACELAAAALWLQRDVRMYRGYVTRGTLGARTRRAIGLHDILVRAQEAIEITALLQRYRAEYPSAICSLRDAAISMEQRPHQFIELLDGLWHALGPTGEADLVITAPYEESADEPSEDEETPNEEPADTAAEDDTYTVAHAIERALRQHGPMRIADLVDQATWILPPDRSIRSIGPTLIVSKDIFVRPLPGVYALPAQVPEGSTLIDAPPSYLLDAEQAKLYALGRRSGERWRAYPLWVPEAEYAWCRWARRYADSELLEALLSVASVDSWPIEEGEKVEWRAFALARGRFSIGFPPNAAAAFSLPDLDRIFAAALVAKREGHMGWMRANRVLLRRVGDHSGAGLLGMLVALGAICPGPDWQLPHPTGPSLEALIERMAGERHRTGTLEWESPLGMELKEAALATSPSALGWLPRPVLLTMFASLGTSPAAAADDVDPLEQLLSERDAAARIARFKAALDALHAESNPTKSVTR